DYSEQKGIEEWRGGKWRESGASSWLRVLGLIPLSNWRDQSLLVAIGALS
mgnify:CR=1